MSARLLICDVFDGIASLEDGSVDLVLTSPPFLALRSYLPADHPDKHREIGSEPTPEAFIDTLLDVVEAITPKLAPHGSLCFELGDTYSGSGGAGGDYTAGGLREGQNEFIGSSSLNRTMTKNARVQSDEHAQPIRDLHGKVQGGGEGWPEAKSLCLIPESFRWALVYGRNPFNGRTTDRWRARNVIRWCRPNPPVGALGDKFRPATSEMVVACKSGKRWFDLDAVRTESRNPIGVGARPTMARVNGTDEHDSRDTLGPFTEEMQSAGAPPLDWWEISTEPYKGSHYATWPRKLLDRPILAMCPQRVCTTCGEPSRRIVEVGDLQATESARMEVWDRGKLDSADGTRGMAEALRAGGFVPNHQRERTTLGWTTCGHDSWRRGVVLDCFAGSGTTLAVAEAHGRDSVGIDIDSRNADLASDRVGMFLTVETLASVVSGQ